MYIRKLQVCHLKRVNELTLDFVDADGKPRMWTVLIGPNGTAKTTLLQAIALAAAGPLQVNSLGRPIVGHLRDRRSSEAMMVDAWFGFMPLGRGRPEIHPMFPAHEAWSDDIELHSQLSLGIGETTIRGGSSYVEGERRIGNAPTRQHIDPLDDARSRNLAHWFVAGYGISRALPDPAYRPRLEQPSIERLEPLFKAAYTLTSLAFSEHFEGDEIRNFAKVLKGTLTRVAELVPDIEGMELRGQGGVRSAGDLLERDRFEQRFGAHTHKIPAVALSHGYQSTISWIADLIGHVMLEAKEPIESTDIEGLVLIDEIDLYLHPLWQASFVTALREVFSTRSIRRYHPFPGCALEPEGGRGCAVGSDPRSG